MHCTAEVRSLFIAMHRSPEGHPPPGSGPGRYTLLVYSSDYIEPRMRKVRCRIEDMSLRETDAGNPYLEIYIEPDSYSDPRCPYRLRGLNYARIGLIEEDRGRLKKDLGEEQK